MVRWPSRIDTWFVVWRETFYKRAGFFAATIPAAKSRIMLCGSDQALRESNPNKPTDLIETMAAHNCCAVSEDR